MQVLLQKRQFLLGNIAGRGVDEQGVAILGDRIHVQQREILRQFIVAAGKLAAEIVRQRLLAVTAEQIYLRQIVTDNIVDGRSDLPFPVKALGYRAGGVVGAAVYLIYIGIGDVAALVPARNHKGIVGDLFLGILLGKGREDIGVLLGYGNMVGKILIPIQQLIQHGVFLACLNDPVDIHILAQVGGDHLGVRRKRVQLRRGYIELGIFGGQHPRQHIDRHQNRQYDHAQRKAVSAHLGGARGQRLFILGGQLPPFLRKLVFHPLYLFFSQTCTQRNRKNTAMLA